MRILPIAAALKDQPLSKVTHGQIIVDRVNSCVAANNHIALNWTGNMISDWIKALDPSVRRSLLGIDILNSGQSITFNAEALDTTTFATADPNPPTGDYTQVTTRIGNVVTIVMTTFIILAVFGVLLYYFYVNGTSTDTSTITPPPEERGNVDE